ncbi:MULTISPECIES: hypothetical protein [unclassified Blastococcus]
MSRPAVRRALPAALFGAALLLTACGSDDDTADATGSAGSGGDTGAVEDAAADSGVPEECAEAYPTAFGPADIADVELAAGFPEPPSGAVLCETGGTADGSQEYANYAAGLSEEEVFAYYEGELAGAERGEDGIGAPILSGTTDGVYWQVQSEDGGFSVLFATE